MIHTEVTNMVLAPYAWLAAFEAKLTTAFGVGQFGAANSFVGYMRDFNDNHPVCEMYLEHYPGMTEKQLQRIASNTVTKHDVLHVAIIHRVETIQPGEAIVVTAAWSAHRQAAYAACRDLIEALKHEAPFWKREQRVDDTKTLQAHWVKTNTPEQ